MPQIIEVKDLRKVDKTKYPNGTLFFSGEKASMLLNNKLVSLTPDLSKYAKKTDLKKVSETNNG